MRADRRLLCLAIVMVPLVGCSISASSSSLSKSVRSSSRSSDSSSSSSPGAAEEAYREDVADYTQAFVRSHRGDVEGFDADLGRLAAEHGITNWEESPDTYSGIGAGLRQAEVSDAELLAYKRNLSRGDPVKADAIQKGYDTAR